MQVLLFGVVSEIIGERSIVIDAAENLQTVGGLKQWLGNKYPAIQNLSSYAVAVDKEFAGDEESLSTNKEVAIIPPVSGG